MPCLVRHNEKCTIVVGGGCCDVIAAVDIIIITIAMN
jgi:hypothetical protein